MAEESQLQRKVRLDLERNGWDVLKINLCSKPGYPDTEVKRALRQIFYIEFKAKGKKPDPLQAYIHRQLRKMGFPVFVIDTWEKYLELKKRL